MNKILGLSLLIAVSFVSSAAAFTCWTSVAGKDLYGHDYLYDKKVGMILLGTRGYGSDSVTYAVVYNQYGRTQENTPELNALVKAEMTDELALCKAQFPNTTGIRK